jgi:hypothetical protein
LPAREDDRAGMLFAAVIGLCAQAIVSLAVGMRLLALARRSRQFPELALAIMTLMPALGYPAMLVVILLERLSLPGVTPIYFVTVSVMMVAVSMNYFFTWRVFRPDRAWAVVLCGLGVWLLLAPVGGVAAHVEASGIDAGIRNAWAFTIPIVSASLFSFAWTAAESFHYFLGASRRMRLGLCDPAVCNRFLLWALASMSWLSAGSLAAFLLGLGVNPLSNGLFTASVGVAGLVNSLCMTLCFMPPERYIGWLQRRAVAPTAA